MVEVKRVVFEAAIELKSEWIRSNLLASYVEIENKIKSCGGISKLPR